jgi:hypothetical protein
MTAESYPLRRYCTVRVVELETEPTMAEMVAATYAVQDSEGIRDLASAIPLRTCWIKLNASEIRGFSAHTAIT